MKRLVPVLLVFLFASCTTTSSDMDAVRGVESAVQDVDTAIRGLVDTFDSQMRAGNTAGFMALYAEDAVLMAPNLPAFAGRAAIQQFWGGMLAAGATDVDLIVDDIQISGDIAVERGHFEVTKPFRDSGKYVVVWRNRGGKWLITHDIFNSNLSIASSNP